MIDEKLCRSCKHRWEPEHQSSCWACHDNGLYESDELVKKTNSTTELKPCPFCGVQPELILEDNLRYYKGLNISTCWIIKCPKCKTKKEAVSLYEFTIEEQFITKDDGRSKVIESWNRRFS